MTPPSWKRYAFGPFELDADDRLLMHGGDIVPLTPKALDTLLILVERNGHVVSKDELLERVWPDSFVEQNNLAQNISALRKALGEREGGPRYIDTVPKRGYRFITPVTARLRTPMPDPGVGAGAADAATSVAAAPGTAAAAAAAAPGAAGTVASFRPLTAGAATGTGTAAGAAADTAEEPALLTGSPTRYARSGDVNIAYQVIGDGPFDLVFVMGWVSHLEYFWAEPSFARFLRRLASFSRLILFDKRGTGLSDRVTALPTLEQRMDDVRAVMDAVGSERAALLGISEGGPMCSLFAATYPEKTLALVMIGTYARRLQGPDYPWGPTKDQHETFLDEIQRDWGGPVGLEARAPSKLQDKAFRDWWATYIRMGASPGAAVKLTRMNADIDVRGVLPSVRVPTLVLHRTGDTTLKVDEGRHVAERIPGARFVELPGIDHLPFVGDQDAMLDEIEGFLTGSRHSEAPILDRVLATVLCGVFEDENEDTMGEQRVVESGGAISLQGYAQRKTRLLSFACREIERARGRIVPQTGPELMATFDGPARAVRCGAIIAEVARRLRLPFHVGAHTGECEMVDDTIRGITRDIAAEVATQAAPGEVLVSRMVRDLVAGSGLKFHDCGRHAQPAGESDLTLYCVEMGHLTSTLLSY
jgi:DNA-binding winged helix-turn-helix (wHTH) protein/pimeloyl-ACP methyl ester carboxylesterase